MKDNRTGKIVGTAGGAEAQTDLTAADLGKFKDVRTLLSAYQALEAEFTRRSQRLKELETRTVGKTETETETNKDDGAPAEAENAQAPSLTERNAEPENAAEISAKSHSSAHIGGAIDSKATEKSKTGGSFDAVCPPAAIDGNAENSDRTAAEAARSAPRPLGIGDLSEEVKNAVIEDYLNCVFLKRGARRTPKTVREAGALAGKLFNNKEEN